MKRVESHRGERQEKEDWIKGEMRERQTKMKK